MLHSVYHKNSTIACTYKDMNTSSFYGSSKTIPRLRFLSSALEAVQELDEEEEEPAIVILPPDSAEQGNESGGEGDDTILDNDCMPTEIAGNMEVHTTGVGGEDEDDHENQEDKICWRKSENISLTELDEVEYNSCIGEYGGKLEDEIFSLFFSDNMLTLLVDQTNLYASRDRNAPSFATDITEMTIFLGLLLISR